MRKRIDPSHPVQSFIYQKNTRTGFYKDMDCKCNSDLCAFTLLNYSFMNKCFYVLEHFKIIITRGFSCQIYNKKLAGRADSYHLIGLAWDIVPVNKSDFNKLEAMCRELFPFVYIIKDKDGNRVAIHCDCRPI